MSLQFKIVSVQIPKEYSEEQTSDFFNKNTSLKKHDQADILDKHVEHFQNKRKLKLKDEDVILINHREFPEVLLKLSKVHHKNKFKTNKGKKRGSQDPEFIGRGHKKSDSASRAEVQE